MKKFTSKNKAWWSNMSANFAGAFLGICLTFGTSAFIDHLEKERLARKVLVITVSNIDDWVVQMDRQYRFLERIDTIFHAVADRYPEDFDCIPKDTLELFVSQFLNWNTMSFDTSAESIFTHSVDVWKTIDDLTLQRDIGRSISFKNDFIHTYQKLLKEREDLFRKVNAKTFFLDYADGSKLVKDILKMPETQLFLFNFTFEIKKLKLLQTVIKQLNKENRKRANLTEEEVDALYESEHEKFSYYETYDF